MYSLYAFSLFALVPGFLHFVSGNLVNVTIGDDDPQVKYLPDGKWAASPCSGCGVSKTIDKTQAYGQSWHDATSTSPDDVRNVTVKFTGTGIYLFGIQPNFIDGGITTLSNATILLDGNVMTPYVHVPDNTTNVAYNVPIYANSSIPYGDHTVTATITAGSTDDKDHYLLLFNYAMYTMDDTPVQSTTQLPTSASTLVPGSSSTSSGSSTPVPAPQPKRTLPIGAIVGAAVGSQVIIVGALLLVWQSRRRRTNARRKFEDSPSVPQDVPANFYTPAPGPPSTAGALSRFGALDLQSTTQPRMAPPAYDSIQGPSALPPLASASASESEQPSVKEAYGAAPYTGG